MTPFRLLPVLALAGTLAGCSPTPLMRGSLETLQAAMSDPPALQLTRAQVEANPYPQLKLATPYGEAGMVLGRVQDGEEFWFTATRQVLVIRNGLVRRSVGFPEDLRSTRMPGDDPFSRGLHRLPDGAESVREVDWRAEGRFGVRLQSRFERRGIEQVEILDRTYELLRVDESIHASDTGFSAINRYWVDPHDGFVMASEQHLSPDLSVTITQLRPYRESAQ